jgi:hypothetical protein
MSTFWPIPLIPLDNEEKQDEKQMAPSIVKKNNLAVYAAVLLSGDNVEGE